MQAQLHARTPAASRCSRRQKDRATKEGGVNGKRGTITWRVDIRMSRVKSMVLFAVFLLSPPPPFPSPLSPVEISHFLQAQCWFHTGAQGLGWESVRWVRGETRGGRSVGVFGFRPKSTFTSTSLNYSGWIFFLNVSMLVGFFFPLTLQSHGHSAPEKFSVQLRSCQRKSWK